MNQSRKTFIAALLTLFTLLGAGPSHAEYEEIIYYHTDALGSPALATREDGNEKWREQYAPYGSRLLLQSRETTGSPPVPIESPWDEKQWFTGKLEETRVGLQYFGARWYDPEIGRFLSPDPVQYTQGNIYSFNRYAYANNNPYRYTDPDGESPIDAVFLAVDVGRLAAAVYSGDTSAVQSAAVDVAFSAVGVVVPIPGAGQALKAAKVAGKVESAARAASGTKSAVKSAEGVAEKLPSTLEPGPHAGESIPVNGPGRASAQQQKEINRIGQETGCHTCGTKSPGTESGNFVLDHQNPSKLNSPGDEQRGFPHCINCSRRQGGEVNAEKARRRRGE